MDPRIRGCDKMVSEQVYPRQQMVWSDWAGWYIPRRNPNPFRSLVADQSVLGAGSKFQICGKIPKPGFDLGKMIKSVVRYEADASDPTAVWRVVHLRPPEEPRGLPDRVPPAELKNEKTRRTEDLRQINLNSTQGVQLMSTPEGNFDFPSTGPSVVVTCWGEDPKPHAVIASPTLNNPNPSHGPELARQCPQYPRKLPDMGHSGDWEIPEVKDYQPRKVPGKEILEEEVYGIDPYTHNCPKEIMPADLDWSIDDKHAFIEVNKQVRHFTGSGNTPMVYPLKPVNEEIQKSAKESGDRRIAKMCFGILKSIKSHPEYNYVAYRKGIGVVCNNKDGFGVDDFVVEFSGEVYPSRRFYEKQDGIKHIQNNSQDKAPEFYNIMLERPKEDRDGYDLVFVEAMHKANYASRICHSCNTPISLEAEDIRNERVTVFRSMKPLQLDDVVIGQHKSHHCYFIRLMLEYFKFSSLDSYEFSACKFHNPKHRHDVILFKSIIAASVGMNSTVSSSKKPGNIVFHIITDAPKFYAMKLWVVKNTYKKAYVHVKKAYVHVLCASQFDSCEVAAGPEREHRCENRQTLKN